MKETREKPRPVTVSIVSHGQWALAKPLLEQLDQWCSGHIEKVVLTLNLPESVAIDPAWRIDVECIENRHPKGFGANHNQNFLRNESPWFLVLNPDIRIQSDVIGELLTHAEPETGLLSPRIFEPGRRDPEPFRGLLSPFELVARRRTHYQAPETPAWIAGMFMLLRREVMTQVKGFDERFFMYCEDFDLCARVRLNGWKLHVAHEVSVLHLAQRASQASFRHLYWHLSSFLKVWTSQAFWRYRHLLQTQAKTKPVNVPRADP